MAETNIFDIIKKERLNIEDVDIYSVHKFFFKYYYKYLLLIKKKLKEQDEIIFEDEVESIGNMFFQISWVILLTSFNVHVTIFFMERASLLLSEFIVISSKEEKYVVESNSKMNDAIIFTLKKTVGDSKLEDILKENVFLKNNNFYKNLLNVRTANYLYIKIANEVLKMKNYRLIEKNMRSCKQLLDPLFNIYQIIDIDNFLYSKCLQILNQENDVSKAIFIIKVILETIDLFLSEYFFNNLDQEIDFFLEILDNNYKEFYKNGGFEGIAYIVSDINESKTFLEFKNCVFRFIEY